MYRRAQVDQDALNATGCLGQHRDLFSSADVTAE
jgi:hypothetical protein